ncbi:DUF6355 family natural product biosynthesis protein [Streptomyces sp. NPDC054863]
MRIPRPLLAVVGAVALVLGTTTAATAAPGAHTQSALMNPCGFYETGSDAFYHHCTTDGSNVIIQVRVALAPDYERCVYPGNHWLGSSSKIQGAHYTGRTC